MMSLQPTPIRGRYQLGQLAAAHFACFLILPSALVSFASRAGLFWWESARTAHYPTSFLVAVLLFILQYTRVRYSRWYILSTHHIIWYHVVVKLFWCDSCIFVILLDARAYSMQAVLFFLLSLCPWCNLMRSLRYTSSMMRMMWCNMMWYDVMWRDVMG